MPMLDPRTDLAAEPALVVGRVDFAAALMALLAGRSVKGVAEDLAILADTPAAPDPTTATAASPTLTPTRTEGLNRLVR